MNLETIAKKHGCTKLAHGYLEHYESFFKPIRTKEINLLEIGVAGGHSLKMCKDYFKSGWIVGVEKAEIPFKSTDSKMVVQDNTDACTDFDKIIPYGPFDVIIDDGSHRGAEQMSSFWGLWDSLLPGGLYVIEDLFALYDPVWNPGGPQIVHEVTARMQNILVGGDSIQEVHWFGRNDINGILFMRKRKEAFRVQPLSEFQ
jgi:hypothetical protein